MNKYYEFESAYIALGERIAEVEKKQEYDENLVANLQKIHDGLDKNFDSIYAIEQVLHYDLLREIKKHIETISKFASRSREL